MATQLYGCTFSSLSQKRRLKVLSFSLEFMPVLQKRWFPHLPGNVSHKMYWKHCAQVTEEVICPKLQELLFFMHSFLTAKVVFVFITITIIVTVIIVANDSNLRWPPWTPPSCHQGLEKSGSGLRLHLNLRSLCLLFGSFWKFILTLHSVYVCHSIQMF